MDSSWVVHLEHECCNLPCYPQTRTPTSENVIGMAAFLTTLGYANFLTLYLSAQSPVCANELHNVSEELEESSRLNNLDIRELVCPLLVVLLVVDKPFILSVVILGRV